MPRAPSKTQGGLQDGSLATRHKFRAFAKPFPGARTTFLCVDRIGLPAAAPHDLLGQPAKPGFGRGVRLRVEVALDGSLQASPPSERGQPREQDTLHELRRLSQAHLIPVAREEQRTQQRRGHPLGVGMAVGAQAPDDEDGLLEAKRWLYAHPGSYLALTRVPPPVPCPGWDRQLLSSFERPLLTVDQERDAAVQNLEVLGTVVVTCSPPGTNPPSSTAKSATIRAPAVSSADSTSNAFSPVSGFHTTSPARPARTCRCY